MFFVPFTIKNTFVSHIGKYFFPFSRYDESKNVFYIMYFLRGFKLNLNRKRPFVGASKVSDVASKASDAPADSTLAVPRFRTDADAFAGMAKRPLATGDKGLKRAYNSMTR